MTSMSTEPLCHLGEAGRELSLLSGSSRDRGK